mmetsp:Transcript_36100/g.77838  ORF Transcript_36100/g.77838 Transcript_36100/m.77838 type:complete len:815 (-) Transcript_36100:91-2535(-)
MEPPQAYLFGNRSSRRGAAISDVDPPSEQGHPRLTRKSSNSGSMSGSRSSSRSREQWATNSNIVASTIVNNINKNANSTTRGQQQQQHHQVDDYSESKRSESGAESLSSVVDQHLRQYVNNTLNNYTDYDHSVAAQDDKPRLSKNTHDNNSQHYRVKSSLDSAKAKGGEYTHICNSRSAPPPQQQRQRGVHITKNNISSNTNNTNRHSGYNDGGWYDGAQDIIHNPKNLRSLPPKTNEDKDKDKDVALEQLRDYYYNQAVEPPKSSIKQLACEQLKIATTATWGGGDRSVSTSDNTAETSSVDSSIDSSSSQRGNIKLKQYAKLFIVIVALFAVVNIYNGENSSASMSQRVGKTIKQRGLTKDHITIQAPSRGIMEDVNPSAMYNNQGLQSQRIVPVENVPMTTNTMLNDIDPNLRGGYNSENIMLGGTAMLSSIRGNQQRSRQPLSSSPELGIAHGKAFEEVVNQGGNDDAEASTSTLGEQDQQHASEEGEMTPNMAMMDQPQAGVDAQGVQQGVVALPQPQDQEGIRQQVQEESLNQQDTTALELQAHEDQAKQQQDLNQVVAQQDMVQQEQNPSPSVATAKSQAQEDQIKQQGQLNQVEQQPLQRQQPLQQEKAPPAMELATQVDLQAAPQEAIAAAELQAPKDQAKQDMFEQNVHADPITVEQSPQVNGPQQEQDPHVVEPPTPAKMEPAEQATAMETLQNQAEEGNLLTATTTEEDLQKPQLQTMKESAAAALEKGRSLLQATAGPMTTTTTEENAEKENSWLAAAAAEQRQRQLQDGFDETKKLLRYEGIQTVRGRPISDSDSNGSFG